MEYQIEGGDVLIISILVLFLGTFITNKIAFLKRYNIPAAVTGGLICSIAVALIYSFAGTEISFDMRTRDLLLLVFFTTIGLTAKFRLLIAGGKALIVLLVIAVIFLFVQDLTGVALVSLMGHHPAYGLFGGSVSFAGGHGTAIAWGQVADEAGLVGAGTVGIACATFGLIAGGVIGGPIAERLIKKNDLSPPKQVEDQAAAAADDNSGKILSTSFIATILVVAVCVEAGDLVNRVLFDKGVLLPGFLTAMFTAIIITNAADLLKVKMSTPCIDLCNEVSLQIFLSMSLMSMQLWTLASAMGPILIILLAQMTVMTFFSVFLVFRFMGRNYDASVTAAGFAGLGLGATPVGIANMNAVTSKYGPSPKSFLIVPLVGAFFLDIANALIIKMFINSPWLQQPLT